ncbi:hypothetical protein JCM8547_009076 [Rhodosporidiobolus lusitaniae]
MGRSLPPSLAASSAVFALLFLAQLSSAFPTSNGSGSSSRFERLSRSTTTTSNSTDAATACANLASSSIVVAASETYTVTNVSYYAANASVTSSAGGGGGPSGVSGGGITGLPAFCRVWVDLNTYNGSAAEAEVWLPDSEEWSGRYLGVGNGGMGGSINQNAMAYSGLINYFATASTNGGHSSTQDASDWALNHPDAIIDFGYRAVEYTTKTAKSLIEAYYGESAKKSYWSGCSDGGRQGLKNAQSFPEDFDGVLVGAPAYWLSHQQAWSIHLSQLVLPENSSTFIPSSYWSTIGEEALRQCDAIDGVEDGFIVDPQKCKFRPEELACRPDSSNSTVCLTAPQLAVLEKIYSDWIANETFIFSSYYPGGESNYASSPHLSSTSPDSLGVDFYQTFVYNDTDWEWESLTYESAFLWDYINTGHAIAANPDLREFEGRGGKLLGFHGWADPNISPGASIAYYRNVERFMNLNTNTNISDYYRLFMIPGMGHCSSGDYPWCIDAADTSSSTLPLSFNSTYSALAALVDWVENDNAPEQLTAVKYVDDDYTQGVNRTRPLCPFPKDLKYDGQGDIWTAESFSCV